MMLISLRHVEVPLSFSWMLLNWSWCWCLNVDLLYNKYIRWMCEVFLGMGSLNNGYCYTIVNNHHHNHHHHYKIPGLRGTSTSVCIFYQLDSVSSIFYLSLPGREVWMSQSIVNLHHTKLISHVKYLEIICALFFMLKMFVE